jgi:hypothetical protein
VVKSGHSEAVKRVLGRSIRRAREQAGYLPGELAKLLGRCQRLVEYWEVGRREPGLTDLMRVASLCGVRLSRLLHDLDGVDPTNAAFQRLEREQAK